MYIINHFYGNIIKNSIKNAFDSNFDIDSVSNYIDFVSNLDNFLCNIIKESITKSFELIDLEYRNSPRRKMYYYTKGLYTRTIMTLFGEVTFCRQYYVPKGKNTDGFFYVDELFSLPKRDYYDPMIKALIIERSAEYSYIQAGKLVGDVIGNRFKSLSDSKLSKISRQTVRNILLKADMDYLYNDVKTDVDTLYIQLDEKWVNTQNHHGKMVEIKAAVIYTDIEEEYNNRNRLVNRHIITSDQSANNLRDKLLDYINAAYNVDKINNIIITGDGANWIKSTTNHLMFNKGMLLRFILDRFHMNQAINHITKDTEIKKYLRDYLKCRNTKNFKELCNALIVEYPHREDVITKNRDYIVSNWRFIKNQNHHLFKGCSMEGHISHVLAALFTSRPKAHSRHIISKRLKIRELFVNNLDLKEIYLSNHINLSIESDDVELNTTYPLTTKDIIGNKVTAKYLWYKEITNSTIFS